MDPGPQDFRSKTRRRAAQSAATITRFMLLQRLIHSLRAAAWATCLLPAALALAAEEPIQAARLQPGERITLDGTLAHPAWQRAAVFDRSFQIGRASCRERVCLAV